MNQKNYILWDNSGWIVNVKSFLPDYLAKTESVFCQGNGRLGLRAVTEESYCGMVRNMFVNGTFNRFSENEVTELPNLPDMTAFEIYINGHSFSLLKGNFLDYTLSLNLYNGKLKREFIWISPEQHKFKMVFERFVSMTERDLVGMKISITPLNCDCKVVIKTGIDGQMTNSGSQHFEEGESCVLPGNILQMCSKTTNSDVFVVNQVNLESYIDGWRIEKPFSVTIGRRKITAKGEYVLSPKQTLSIEKLALVITSRDIYFDGEQHRPSTYYKTYAETRGGHIFNNNFDFHFGQSEKTWKKVWNEIDIEISASSNRDQTFLRFAMYHLMIMTDIKDSRMGIGAKGLSGEGYKGHSFWDTEIFIMPFFLFTQPDVARIILSYRGKSLPGAYAKAKKYGYKGAMFPWESAWLDDGEVTPDWGGTDIVTGKAMEILTGHLEQHISADIAFAIYQYYVATDDTSFMEQFGYEIVLGTAEFWLSRIEIDAEGIGHINDVIGPDEYKEHVNDNAFTNHLVFHNLAVAEEFYDTLMQNNSTLLDKLVEKTNFNIDKCREIKDKLYLPQVNSQGLMEQFEGYFNLSEIDLTKYKNASTVGNIYNDYNMKMLSQIKVSKQADTLLLMLLLENVFPEECKKKNYYYYEAKTLHDSSLSKCSHSILAADIGLLDEAYKFFKEGMLTDFGDNLLSSDEGIHSACMGGIWQSVVMGFGGIRIAEEGLRINPVLPKEWNSLKFSIYWRGIRTEISINGKNITVKNEGNKSLNFSHRGQEYWLEPRKKLVFYSNNERE